MVALGHPDNPGPCLYLKASGSANVVPFVTKHIHSQDLGLGHDVLGNHYSAYGIRHSLCTQMGAKGTLENVQACPDPAWPQGSELL